MKPIRILIDDGLMLARDKPTGIGWYTLNLLETLPELGVEVKRIQYSLFFCRLPAPVKRLAYMVTAHHNRRRTDVDVVHYTNFFVPPRRHRARVVSTVHDLTAFLYPETLTWSYRGYSRRATTNAIRYADRVLVPSEAVRDELLDRFKPLSPDRIRVVYQDIRDLFFRGTSEPLVPREHFLYVGVLEKRKNLAWLIRTFSRFAEHRPSAKLILIGKPGYGYTEIERAIFESRNVIYQPYLSDEGLVSLYRKSYALILPSVYEGFGRPVVEAMAMGLPVLASDIPTNRELRDRHGKIVLFDLSRPDDLLDLLDQFLKATPERIDYGDLGLYRRMEVARRHVEAYSGLL